MLALLSMHGILSPPQKEDRMSSTQDYNAAYLNALWLGPAIFERQLENFTRIVERAERASELRHQVETEKEP